MMTQIIAPLHRNKAGRPPKFDNIRMPSMWAKLIMIQAIRPIITPQTILIILPGSGLSGEIPVELSPPIAEVLESAAVTNEMKVASRNTGIKSLASGK